MSQGERRRLSLPVRGELEVLGVSVENGRRQIVARMTGQVEQSLGALTFSANSLAIRTDDIDDPVRSSQIRRVVMPIPAEARAQASPNVLPAFVTVWVYGYGDAPFLLWR